MPQLGSDEKPVLMTNKKNDTCSYSVNNDEKTLINCKDKKENEISIENYNNNLILKHGGKKKSKTKSRRSM